MSKATPKRGYQFSYRNIDAVKGHPVTPEFAKSHPKTTVKQRIEIPIHRKKN